MKVTIQDGSREVIVIEDTGSTADVVSMCKGAMIAFGFHPDNVSEYFTEEV